MSLRDALKEKLRQEASRNVDTAATALLTSLYSRVPVDTGELRQSIRWERDDSGDVLGVKFEATAPQAEWTDQGTRPHLIEGSPLLAFFWPRAGSVVFLRHVNHPGNRAQHWFSDTMDEWGSVLGETFAASG